MRIALALVMLCGCGSVREDPAGDAAVDMPGIPDSGIDAPGPCPSGFMDIGAGSDHRYLVLSNIAAHATHATACKALAPTIYLAVPDEQVELDAFATKLTSDFWVGVDDLATEGTYVTAKGQPATFLPWATGQPSNTNNQDCVAVLVQSLAFDDIDCQLQRTGLCECEP